MKLTKLQKFVLANKDQDFYRLSMQLNRPERSLWAALKAIEKKQQADK